jgi:hypothetical protein
VFSSTCWHTQQPPLGEPPPIASPTKLSCHVFPSHQQPANHMPAQLARGFAAWLMRLLLAHALRSTLRRSTACMMRVWGATGAAPSPSKSAPPCGWRSCARSSMCVPLLHRMARIHLVLTCPPHQAGLTCMSCIGHVDGVGVALTRFALSLVPAQALCLNCLITSCGGGSLCGCGAAK